MKGPRSGDASARVHHACQHGVVRNPVVPNRKTGSTKGHSSRGHSYLGTATSHYTTNSDRGSSHVAVTSGTLNCAITNSCRGERITGTRNKKAKRVTHLLVVNFRGYRIDDLVLVFRVPEAESYFEEDEVTRDRPIPTLSHEPTSAVNSYRRTLHVRDAPNTYGSCFSGPPNTVDENANRATNRVGVVKTSVI